MKKINLYLLLSLFACNVATVSVQAMQNDITDIIVDINEYNEIDEESNNSDVIVYPSVIPANSNIQKNMDQINAALEQINKEIEKNNAVELEKDGWDVLTEKDLDTYKKPRFKFIHKLSKKIIPRRKNRKIGIKKLAAGDPWAKSFIKK